MEDDVMRIMMEVKIVVEVIMMVEEMTVCDRDNDTGSGS